MNTKLRRTYSLKMTSILEGPSPQSTAAGSGFIAGLAFRANDPLVLSMSLAALELWVAERTSVDPTRVIQ